MDRPEERPEDKRDQATQETRKLSHKNDEEQVRDEKIFELVGPWV